MNQASKAAKEEVFAIRAGEADDDGDLVCVLLPTAGCDMRGDMADGRGAAWAQSLLELCVVVASLVSAGWLDLMEDSAI